MKSISSEKWQPARLIPVSGLNAGAEQERRGASALLAVMQSVSEYGRSILSLFGAPNGTIKTFIEVPFDFAGKPYRPDGLIQVSRGSKVWTALVEVKTLRNKLDATQVATYLEIAREQGYDAVITISNELETVGGGHPLKIDKRLTRNVTLHHISWSLLHSEALFAERKSSVKDPDQAWILSEFVRYLQYPKSGAIDFDDMGAYWVTVRESAINSTLRATDSSALDVVDHYSQLMRYVAMHLSSRLGVDVRRVLKKAERADPSAFIARMATELSTDGRMIGEIAIPSTAAPMVITSDLRAGKVFISLNLEAPRTGRPSTKVNWLIRQLKNAQSDLLVNVVGTRSKEVGPVVRLDKLLINPELLISDVKFEVRGFVLQLSGTAGTKRGQGKSSFVDSVLSLVYKFYEGVLQDLKPWMAPTPKVVEPPVILEESVETSRVAPVDPPPQAELTSSEGTAETFEGDTLN
jgi:hypothetical protein